MPPSPPPPDVDLHARAAKRLAFFCWFVALESLVFIVQYVASGWFGDASFPFVTNSSTKDALFMVCGALAATAPRRHGSALALILYGHCVIVGLNVIAGIIGHTDTAKTLTPPLGLHGDVFVWLWSALAALVAAVGFWLRHQERRTRFGLKYLSHGQFTTLVALADVLIEGDDEPIGPEEVALRVDGFLASFRSTAKGRIRLALLGLHVYPLLVLRPPMDQMDYEPRKRFIARHFERVLDRRLPGFVKQTLQAMIRAAQQMAFLGFYGDARAAANVGYVPFSERPEAKDAKATPRKALRVRSPRDVTEGTVRADVAIIGSGAGGAIVADRLTKAGKHVVMLERGLHVDPADFTEDEADMFSRLYADGALQLSRDLRFSVLQGMCVGGSTTVNNAVCLRAPDTVLGRWQDATELDIDQLAAAYARIEAELPVSTMPSHAPLNPSGTRLQAGLDKLGQPAKEFEVVSCNIADCLGCGYCNIGCRWGRKLSALDAILPRAQAQGDLEIISECLAETVADGRVEARLANGKRIQVLADQIVVAGGAIASSLLLERSGLGGEAVGHGLACNMGVPVLGDFEEEVRAFAGLQIGHVFAPPPERGFVFETWFNPVMAQALVMPGWFGEHWANMRRYAHYAGAGCVVGTGSYGVVKASRTGGPDLRFTPSREDTQVLVEGMKLLGRAWFAAGAQRVVPSTFENHLIDSESDLDELDEYASDPAGLFVNSAHPQGGNRYGDVVDREFRVKGTKRVFVADASLFPSAITVNPQLTVMALADLAAQTVIAA